MGRERHDTASESSRFIRIDGHTSNQIFDELENWNKQLETNSQTFRDDRHAHHQCNSITLIISTIGIKQENKMSKDTAMGGSGRFNLDGAKDISEQKISIGIAGIYRVTNKGPDNIRFSVDDASNNSMTTILHAGQSCELRSGIGSPVGASVSLPSGSDKARGIYTSVVREA